MEQEAREEDTTLGAVSDGLLYFGPARSLTTTPYEETLIMDDRRAALDLARAMRERQRNSFAIWCPRSESNRHAFKGGGF